MNPLKTEVIASSLSVRAIVSCKILLAIALRNDHVLESIISALLIAGNGVFVSMLPYFLIGFGAS